MAQRLRQDCPHASAELGYGEDFILTLWTDDPGLAQRVDAAGVDRIGLDLETLGKAERQPGGLATWISPHSIESLPQLRRSVSSGRLFCRTNPVNPDTPAEIEALLAEGVDVLMLPMFTKPHEVEQFVQAVDGQARVVLLVENIAAARAIEDIVCVAGVDEIHIGLNDLTLSLGRPGANRFEVMGSDIMARLAAATHQAGLRFAVGGIGRPMNNNQPVPADLIYAQYPRLGARGALIARSFFNALPDETDFDVAAELKRARDRLSWWAKQPGAVLEKARQDLLAKTRGAGW